MGEFQYEWWTVEMTDTCSGRITWEFKARDREHALRQIMATVKRSTSESNANKPVWKRLAPITEVHYETLTLDRKGYQRRF